jgi:sulfite oxidase
MFFRSLRGALKSNQRIVFVAATVGSSVTAWSGSTQSQTPPRSLCQAAASVAAAAESTVETPSAPSETFYTPNQVAERNGVDHPDTWVSFRGKVYDITDFMSQHPGGSIIHDAAGGPLENYWAYWAYHTLLDKPMIFLKRYEIGISIENDESESLDDIRQQLYEGDPNRQNSGTNGQIPLCYQPWCSETTPSKLTTMYTPNYAFYVRNHAPVPDLDADDHSITLIVAADSTSSQLPNSVPKQFKTTLNLEDLTERYPTVTIPSILQCAGNRAADLMAVAPTAFAGTPFAVIQTGLMGNAEWKGVRLSQVLLDAFPFLQDLTDTEMDQMHVEFEGADQYRASTTLRRILDPASDALLCTEMNGEPLPRDHGYPVRVFLPGVAGCRNVKWLHSVRLLAAESDSCFQKTYYLGPHGEAIQEMPMQAFVSSKKKLKSRTSTGSAGDCAVQWKVTGIAWGGGSGVGIDRVQVSTDGGETWLAVQNVQVGPARDASNGRGYNGKRS